MTRTIELREFCHSRSGDKSDALTLSLIPYDTRHYDLIRDQVTAGRVKDYFGSMCQGDVERYELPNIAALNFVLHKALGGGCNRTLRFDLHGKALSGPFLDMRVDVPDDFRLPSWGPHGYEANDADRHVEP
jgi:hypothetical protein